MALRDVEDLTIKTLQYTLSQVTGIPSGQIYAFRPAIEFVQKIDGPNIAATNPVIFPAISINEIKSSDYNPNNYGDSIYITPSSGYVTEYSPLAELKMFFDISIWANSKRELREYGVKLEHHLLSTSSINFINDVIPNEYFGIKLEFKKDIVDNMPVRRAYTVTCHARILKETTAYTVDLISASIGTVDNVSAFLYPTDAMFNYAASGTVWG